MRLIPESLLWELTGRQGDMPQPGNDRWGKAKVVNGGDSYTFINTGMMPIVTPMALQMSFSMDGVIFTPWIPIGFPNNVFITLTKAVDVKSGAFTETTSLNPGEAMPFCTLIAKALTVTVENTQESNPPLFVHAVACPTTAIDCGSVTVAADAVWDDVQSVSVAANHVGVFTPILASTATRQVIIQNNSAVPLDMGFGSVTPSIGPPLVASMILPGGINGIWESQFGAFQGAVHAIFGPGGAATDYATFTKGIHV